MRPTRMTFRLWRLEQARIAVCLGNFWLPLGNDKRQALPAAAGLEQEVQQLLDGGANVKWTTPDGSSALHAAKVGTKR